MKISSLLLMALFTPAVLAQTQLTDSLRFSGFGSTSMTRSDQETPIFTKREIKNEWCFDCDTILGFQLDWDISTQLRSSVQVVKRPQDEFSSPELEWAFISYQVKNANIKLGRLRLPLFMMSEYYYVTQAYPWTRPPQDVYESILGITHYDGMSLDWTTWVTDDTQLRVAPFIALPHEQSYSAYGSKFSIETRYTYGISADLYRDDNSLRLSIMETNYTQTFELGETTKESPEIISLGWSHYFQDVHLLTEALFTKDLHANWYISIDKTWENWTPYLQYGQQRRIVSSESFLVGVQYSILTNLSINMEIQYIYGRDDPLNGHFIQIQDPTKGIETEVQLYTLGLSFTF